MGFCQLVRCRWKVYERIEKIQRYPILWHSLPHPASYRKYHRDSVAQFCHRKYKDRGLQIWRPSFGGFWQLDCKLWFGPVENRENGMGWTLRHPRIVLETSEGLWVGFWDCSWDAFWDSNDRAAKFLRNLVGNFANYSIVTKLENFERWYFRHQARWGRVCRVIW